MVAEEKGAGGPQQLNGLELEEFMLKKRSFNPKPWQGASGFSMPQVAVLDPDQASGQTASTAPSSHHHVPAAALQEQHRCTYSSHLLQLSRNRSSCLEEAEVQHSLRLLPG